MHDSQDEVVKIASGDLILMEIFQQALQDAGINSHVVGDNLDASLGTAIPNSIELYVKMHDAPQAEKILERVEVEAERRKRAHKR